MGNKYYLGNGVEQNYVKARQLFEQAAEQGHHRALNNLGVIYLQGQGVEVNYQEAYILLQLATNLGASLEGTTSLIGQLQLLLTKTALSQANKEIKARQKKLEKHQQENLASFSSEGFNF